MTGAYVIFGTASASCRSHRLPFSPRSALRRSSAWPDPVHAHAPASLRDQQSAGALYFASLRCAHPLTAPPDNAYTPAQDREESQADLADVTKLILPYLPALAQPFQG